MHDQPPTWSGETVEFTTSDPLRCNLLDIHVIGLALNGRAPNAPAPARAHPLRPPRVAGDEALVGPNGLGNWIGQAVARAWTDDLTSARTDLSDAFASSQDQPALLPWEPIGLGLLAEIEYQLGAWDESISHAERAVSLARERDQDWLAPFVHAVAVLPLAARGSRKAAKAHAMGAAAGLELVERDHGMIWVATAQAWLGFAEDDHEKVAAALQPITALPDMDEHVWRPSMGLAVEALAALGRDAEAEHLLTHFENLAAASGRHSVLAVAAKARGALEGALGHPDLAEEAFSNSLGHARKVRMPFERALIEAAYGRFLHRMGRRSAAASHLELAREGFADLGASPYLQRCDHELAACSQLNTKRKLGTRPALTPQELAVARLVATGQTNRQAAAELVVSVKTIEYHLSNAYAKLGVTSRTQLALAVNKDQVNP
jgi:DNA-binding CsgD family transcriptional regulator